MCMRYSEIERQRGYSCFTTIPQFIFQALEPHIAQRAERGSADIAVKRLGPDSLALVGLKVLDMKKEYC